MDLNFTKQADRWVAEFIATDDFNLHIEGVVEGNVSVFQRGSESGNYAFVKEGTPHPSYANVYDYDFAALIYPKFIKVSCATEPTSGIVTSNGEITEIKAQTKEIEVTSNGTTTVAPDAGFAYLNSVKVKTNVQSGGGSAMEYWDVTALPLAVAELCMYGLLVKFKKNDTILVRSMGSIFGEINAEDLETSLVAIALDRNIKMIDNKDGAVATVGEIFESKGFPDFTALGWKQITEEEFYNINE